jgi:glycosyltransferase involved in cell wall biosynthesis
MLLHGNSFDVVHANEAHALTAAWLARAHQSAALVASRRVAFPLKKRPLARPRYRAAQQILAVSEHVAGSVVASGIDARKVAVVYDGVELPVLASSESKDAARQRFGADADSVLLGCVGYLTPEKGQDCLVRALPAIRAVVPKTRLVLAGDGPERRRLERLTKELSMESFVHFAGHVEDVSEIYKALDIFVFPSLEEPLGSSLIAAMAWGLPVVASAAGGVTEVVEADVSGKLFPPQHADALARATLDLLTDRQLATRLGHAARKRVQERFTADAMVEATLRVYSELKRIRSKR